jgi:hypothetical protein
MTIADVIENVVNERLYGIKCDLCKISQHFISLYPECDKVSSWIEPVCTEPIVTVSCTTSIAPVSDPDCSPTITLL